MDHLIQPITIDGAAYCCKCYGVSAKLGRGTKGVLTDDVISVLDGIQTAVITNDCSPWTLLTGSANVDIYELWWAEGNMDDTMIYTTGGVDYFANWYNGYPKLPGLFDPWKSPAGIVGSRAFHQRDFETYQYYVFNGPTLRQVVATGDYAPAINNEYPATDPPAVGELLPATDPAELHIQNFQGESGGDTTNHYWKKIYDGTAGTYEPEGEISFGVSCGETVYFKVSSSSTGGSGDDHYDVDVEFFVDGVSESTFSLTPTDDVENDFVEVTGGPCGTIVTFHAKSLDSTAADNTTTVTVTLEVTSIA